MQHLHAYWRMEYVEAPKPLTSGSNPFIELPKLGDDKKASIVWRGEYTYVVLNIYPYNAGHVMVVPYKEEGNLAALSTPEQMAIMETIVLTQKALYKALSPDGFNIGMNLGSAAGAGIPNHLHVHVVPRWDGDTNFMPVLGGAKVLHRSLETMWDLLKKSFHEVENA